MCDKNVLEAMLACFRMFCSNVLETMMACYRIFRSGPTWEEALCMFEPKKASRSDAGMLWLVLLWPTVGRGLVHV